VAVAAGAEPVVVILQPTLALAALAAVVLETQVMALLTQVAVEAVTR